MMKKIVIVIFLTVMVISAFSQIQGYKSLPSGKECSLEKCLAHCVNHKKICSVWDENGYMETYREVIDLNKSRLVNLNKIEVGDSIIFPPFSSWNVPIGKKAILVAREKECIWTLVHRYLGENYLFCLDQRNRDIVNHVFKPKTKSKNFFGTTIIW